MPYFKVDPSIVVFFSGEPIFQDELFGNASDFDADLFRIYQWRVKVNFCYVDGQKLGSLT